MKRLLGICGVLVLPILWVSCISRFEAREYSTNSLALSTPLALPPAVENLNEMFARKSRLLSASWPTSTLEGDATHHYLWQPETLMYRDTFTNNEVWKLTTTQGGGALYHPDIARNPWSADGKRLSFSSKRPTKAFNNYDNYNKAYQNIWFLIRTNGTQMRTPKDTPSRTVNSYPLMWSPQIPDVYYQTGDDHYLGSSTTPGTLYRVTASDTAVSHTPLITGLPLSGRGVDLFGVSISSDGSRLLLVDRMGGSAKYSSAAMLPVTVFPEASATNLVPLGYPYYRGTGLAAFSNVPSFFPTAHAGTYVLLGPKGESFFTVPTGSHCHWVWKTLGTSPDGGPLYTGNKLGPNHQGPFDFGEITPDYGCDPNPFNSPYRSHVAWDRWGRYSVYSFSAVKPYGPGIWDHLTKTTLITSFGGDAQHHDWEAFSDWAVSTRGAGADKGCTADGYPGGDLRYTHDEIATEHYLTATSRKVLVKTHTLFNNFGCYRGASVEYPALPRPSQSPDGTKVAFHSTFLNQPSTLGDNQPDIYWTIAYYPYPPTNLTASWNSGVRINWLPPKYTTRGWPNENTDPAPFAREVRRYHIWRSASANGGWQELGTVNAQYHHDATYGWVHDTANLSFTDLPGNGTWYYALTTEEHSSLESQELSEILSVQVEGSAISAQEINQARGQTQFWTQKPPAPSSLTVTAGSSPGHFQLSWIEPSDSKIRYYNIYYSPDGTPATTQAFRIASLPVGTHSYLDWLAKPQLQGFYRITSVDRYGNESP